MDLLGFQPFLNHQIDRFGLVVFDVGPRGIEMSIGGHHVPFFTHDLEQNSLCCPSLMCGYHMFVTCQVLNHLQKPVETAAAGVCLVASHHSRPLLRTHGGRSAIGEKIDEHIFRLQHEYVVMSFLQFLFALLARRHLYRFDYFNLEGLDDRLHL